MSQNNKSAEEWSDEFDQIPKNVTQARSILEILKKWIWNNVVGNDVLPAQMPRELADAIAALDNELQAIEQTNGNLRWYFCLNPLDKYLKGQQLTREEFYLLAAQGYLTVPCGISSRDAFKVFTLHFYEDDERYGYINPSERPDSPAIPTNGGCIIVSHLKIGVVPEDVRKRYLREEQTAYFKEYQRELFSRFRDD